MNGRRLRLFSGPIMSTLEREKCIFSVGKGKDVGSEFARILCVLDVDVSGIGRKCPPQLHSGQIDPFGKCLGAACVMRLLSHLHRIPLRSVSSIVGFSLRGTTWNL